MQRPHHLHRPAPMFRGHRAGFFSAALAVAAIAGTTEAQPCAYEWGAVPGASGVVAGPYSMVVFDDGTGPALYVGGGGGPNVVKWNGASWSPVGTGVVGTVRAMAVFNDGGGSALYAGGTIEEAGGVPVSNIAKWNGSTWSPCGVGIGNPNSDRVDSLAVFDDGSGLALFVGGEQISAAGGQPAKGIAKWDGQLWSPLGLGLSDSNNPGFGGARALAVYNDGGGAALYAGGGFDLADGQPTSQGIARWDGHAWSPVGSGVAGGAFGPGLFALAAFDDGSGPALYAGGYFESAGGVPADRIARWNGQSWSDVGGGVGGGSAGLTYVTALHVFDDGAGPGLYAAGNFSRQLAPGQSLTRIGKWDGTTWSPLGAGIDNTVYAIAGFQGALYAGGMYDSAGGVQVQGFARWICNPTGACCMPSGACEARTSLSCDNAGGTYNGDGSDCGSVPPCPQPPTGACCTGGTGCVIDWVGGCAAQGGLYQGDNTTCATADCNIFLEVEPNDTKAEANPVVLASGGAIAGVSIDPATPDYFLIQTTSAPLGVYRHQLVLSNATAAGNFDLSNTTLMPAMGQLAVPAGPWPCAVGTANGFEDDGQGHRLIGNDRVNHWYGFGKQEQIYYRVRGNGFATGTYVATLQTTPISPMDLGSFVPGVITIDTAGQGHTSNTHLRVWDSSLNAIHGYANDHASTNGGAPANSFDTSFLRREYTPGTYYLGITIGQLATNQGAPCDDNKRSGNILDFPDVALCYDEGFGASTTTNVSFRVTDSAGTTAFPASREGPSEMAWFKFTVGTPCYANCDGSTLAPVLNVADFTCFLQRFAAGEAYANCDESTIAPVLNVADFTCFLQKFAAECP